MLGIVIYALATFLIVVMNACAKMASDYHAPVEILFYRSVIAMILLLLYVGATRRGNIFKTSRIKGHLARSLIGNIGVILVFWAYALMPMADVTAILFAGPLLVTVLSGLILKERVGPWRWGAVLAGFAGVMLIVQPTGNVYSLYQIAVAMGAVIGVGTLPIILRGLGSTEDAATTTFYFLSFGILMSGVYMIFKGSLPHYEVFWPLIGTGVAGGLQLIIKTQAYRWAEASLLSPFSYTSIVWATMFGWLFWGDLPTLWVVCGAIIVIASNLFILWREKASR